MYIINFRWSFKNKKNEELFVIDNGTVGQLTQKQKALLPPRCFEVLKPLTAVPDPIVKRFIFIVS